MTTLGTNRHDDGPRSSLQRAAAELANAATSYSLNMAYSAAGATLATNTTGIKSVNTITFTVNGVFKSKTATDPLWTLGVANSNTTVNPSSWQKYLLMLNASGTATVQEGVQSTVSAAAVGWTNLVNRGPWSPILTTLDAATTIVCVLTIATDTTAGGFIPGTTALNAANVTATYADGIDPSVLPVIMNEIGSIVGNF